VTQAIITALKALDVSNDNHWTADGLPRLDTVKMMASDQSLTREAVSEAAPGFTRSTAADFVAVDVTAGEQSSSPEGAGGASGGEAATPPVQPGSGEGQGEGSGDGAASSQPAANADPASPSAEAQPGEVGGGEGRAADEVSSLEAELAEAEEKVERIRAFLDEGQRRLKEAQGERDAIQNKLDTLYPQRDSHADAVQAYLASQRRQGELRAARMSAIQESGLNLKELSRSLKAPIDSAMSRRTERGGQRPTRI
jgi:hypothetical protein